MKQIAIMILKQENCLIFERLKEQEKRKIMEGIQKIVMKIWKGKEEDKNLEYIIDAGIEFYGKMGIVKLNFIFKENKGIVKVDELEIKENWLGKSIEWKNQFLN